VWGLNFWHPPAAWALPPLGHELCSCPKTGSISGTWVLALDAAIWICTTLASLRSSPAMFLSLPWGGPRGKAYGHITPPGVVALLLLWSPASHLCWVEGSSLCGCPRPDGTVFPSLLEGPGSCFPLAVGPGQGLQPLK
jgi:hypothetical protein